MISVKRFTAWVRGFFPSKLPTSGKADFEAFTTSILNTYGLQDLPSYRETIATMILHTAPTTDKVSKKAIAIAIRKSMANQIAFDVLQDLKEERKKKAAEEEEAKKKTEATQPESLGDPERQ